MPRDPHTAVAPADPRVLVGSLAERLPLFIKNKFFEYAELLGRDRHPWLATFRDGDYAIFRLTPEKYHYNHAPVSGTVLDHYDIEGQYHSCNPGAALRVVSPYSKNRRVVTVIDTDVPGGTGIGKVAMVEPGGAHDRRDRAVRQPQPLRRSAAAHPWPVARARRAEEPVPPRQLDHAAAVRARPHPASRLTSCANQARADARSCYSLRASAARWSRPTCGCARRSPMHAPTRRRSYILLDPEAESCMLNELFVAALGGGVLRLPDLGLPGAARRALADPRHAPVAPGGERRVAGAQPDLLRTVLLGGAAGFGERDLPAVRRGRAPVALGTTVLVIAVLGVSVPASRLVAWLVERKSATFSVGGAAFVGILVAPWAVLAANAWVLPAIDTQVPLLPALAAHGCRLRFRRGSGAARLHQLRLLLRQAAYAHRPMDAAAVPRASISCSAARPRRSPMPATWPGRRWCRSRRSPPCFTLEPDWQGCCSSCMAPTPWRCCSHSA
ncbi:MAG: phosphatidylserine decarboxylase [Chromatiales bacterium]|nr:phosphatidylserine decarboxylase [Chromatiales bacterium]